MALPCPCPNAVPKYTYDIYIELWSETETQEVPFEHQETRFYFEDDWALQWFAVIAQRDCAVLVLGDTRKLSLHIPVPGQWALGGPAWAGQLDQMTFRASSIQVSSNFNHPSVNFDSHLHKNAALVYLEHFAWKQQGKGRLFFLTATALPLQTQHNCCRAMGVTPERTNPELAGELLLRATWSEDTVGVKFNHLRTGLWMIQVTDLK